MRDRFGLKLVAVVLVVLATLAAPVLAQTPGAGIISGRVLDDASGEPMAGAQVVVEGTTVMGSTGRDGNFRLTAVPAGAQTVVVTYLGRADARESVTVAAGSTASVVLRLSAADHYEETVQVSALLLDAQARALNQQKTAPNITNIVSADQIGHFPDPNAAEATQRIPGVSIQRDMGEGRYVIVRGTEPRLNSTLIDGERIPAPEANVRQVALDVIPADLLQAVEVSKALTPDMDVVFSAAADSTDGLDVTSAPLGPEFPEGLLVAMNSKRRNFLRFDWRTIAQAMSARAAHPGLAP